MADREAEVVERHLQIIPVGDGADSQMGRGGIPTLKVAEPMQTPEPEQTQSEPKTKMETVRGWLARVRKIYTGKELAALTRSLGIDEGGKPLEASKPKSVEASPIKRLWKTLVMGIDEVNRIIDEQKIMIASGGACNLLRLQEDGSLKLVRNTSRDGFNAWLSNILGVSFFDPQIELSTHGRSYDYAQDGPTERKALGYSLIDVTEINPYSLGAVSCLEVVRDRQNPDSRRVLFFSGDQENGNLERALTFQPEGIETQGGMELHFKENEKRANQMRAEVLTMIREDNLEKTDKNPDGNVSFVVDKAGQNGQELEQVSHLLNEVKGQAQLFVITPDESHLVDLFSAFEAATRGERVILYFKGGRVDAKGRPIVKFNPLSTLSEVEKQQFVTNYKKEGTALRHALVDSIRDDKKTTAVLTEAALKQQFLSTYQEVYGELPNKVPVDVALRS